MLEVHRLGICRFGARLPTAAIPAQAAGNTIYFVVR